MEATKAEVVYNVVCGQHSVDTPKVQAVLQTIEAMKAGIITFLVNHPESE